MWTIENFKGINKASVGLKEGDFNLLAGANSSGKSSIIQALLLFAQSYGSRKEIVLNGPLVRLGNGGDLVRNNKGKTKVAFPFTAPSHDEGNEEIEYEAIFSLEASIDKKDLSIVELSIFNSKNKSKVFEFITDRDIDEERLVLSHGNPAPNTRIFPLRLSFSGFQPRNLLAEIEQGSLQEAYLSTITKNKALSGISNKETSSIGWQFGVMWDILKISPSEESWELQEFILEKLDSEPKKQSQNNVSKILESLSKLNDEDISYVVGKIFENTEFSNKIEIDISTHSSRNYRWDIWDKGVLSVAALELHTPVFHILSSLSSEIRKLAGKINYLGPLRDDPRVLWTQWNSEAQGLPTGAKGEFTSAVLVRNSEKQIHCVLPAPTADSGKIEFATPQDIELINAVNSWVDYLGIGESVSINDQGKLGVGAQIGYKGTSRDLTAVGVGVSQALPLIVSLLIAPENSIFLVEQPELHLHPEVQSKLADFLLSARPDLTSIVETHSEAILTRVRRRTAEGNANPDRIKVIFVESTHDGAFSRDLELDSYGDLSEWPEGFLSGLSEDIYALMNAQLEKTEDA